MIQSEQTRISDVYIVSDVYTEDDRGFVKKTCVIESMRSQGIIDLSSSEVLFIHSRQGVIRGLHFQKKHPQARFVSCLSGKVWVVVVDLRKDSDTYGEWIGVELGTDRSIAIPRGCALGTAAITDTLISCINDGDYYAEDSTGIIWNDPDLAIDWPLDLLGENVRVSEKDAGLGRFNLNFQDN